MKQIHPVYFEKAEAVCACGQKYEVGSTLEKIKVEVCRACHPLFTGREKILDAAGRVEKFRRRKVKSEKLKA